MKKTDDRIGQIKDGKERALGKELKKPPVRPRLEPKEKQKKEIFDLERRIDPKVTVMGTGHAEK